MVTGLGSAEYALYNDNTPGIYSHCFMKLLVSSKMHKTLNQQTMINLQL